MNAIGATSTVNWPGLFDELKNREGIASDAKLAETLGVTRSYICSVRKGRKALSLNIAQTILLRLDKGFDTADIKELFVPMKVLRHVGLLASIRALVLRRAGGHCQLCEVAAPFKDAQGNPYLQIHHVVSVKNGGSSTADNLVALCPNCHVKIEVNATAAEKGKLLNLAAKYKEQQSYIEDHLK